MEVAEANMITPVVGHTTCDLDQQRRVIEARREGAARRAAAARRSGRRSVFRGPAGRPRRGHSDPDLATRGEDVWRALRF
jgi:hypothetical protein